MPKPLYLLGQVVVAYGSFGYAPEDTEQWIQTRIVAAQFQDEWQYTVETKLGNESPNPIPESRLKEWN